MKGLDINLLVRLLVADDPAQTEAARDHVQRAEARGEPCYVSVIALCETAWVLERGYGLTKAEVADALDLIAGARNVRIEDESGVRAAIDEMRDRGADFADALMGVRNAKAGCDATVTFDKRAAKLPSFVLLGTKRR